jgi:hypothetical protein
MAITVEERRYIKIEGRDMKLLGRDRARKKDPEIERQR